MVKRWFGVCLAALSVTVTDGAALNDAPPTLVILTDRTRRVDDVVRFSRGKIVFRLPEANAAIAELADGALPSLSRDPSIVVVSRERLVAAQLDRLSPEVRIVAEAWNQWRVSQAAESLDRSAGAAQDGDDPLQDDALIAAEWWKHERTGPPVAAEESLRPSGAGWENTSEYLAGRVSINLLLPESDGTREPSQENWTAAQESSLLAKLLAATDTLRTLYPGSDLTFSLHLLSGRTDARLRVGIEPIAHAADPFGTTGEEVWSTEILHKLGYVQGSRWVRSRLLADATRLSDRSDWALNLFVVNSSKDADGKFLDGRFAYAWLGGPHAVLTSKNGPWGPGFFDKVVRHEIHHAFFGLDEYAASSCSAQNASGYLSGYNDNCENGGSTHDACVMRDNGAYFCTATARQIGTLDADRDGTADLLQVLPEVSLADGAGSSCGQTSVLEGVARVGVVENRNPQLVTPARAITLSTVREVQLRIDGGAWQTGLAYAVDGRFDAREEPFTVSLSLSLDRHTIEARAVDSRGVVSPSATWSVDTVEPTATVGDSLGVTWGPSGTTLTWAGAKGAASYRIWRSATPRGLRQTVPLIEVASTSWSDSAAGSHFYLVEALDGCGNEAGP